MAKKEKRVTNHNGKIAPSYYPLAGFWYYISQSKNYLSWLAI
jgi:hypothetical protein